MSLESDYAAILLGRECGVKSQLYADVYKASMQQAGFPFRVETFYLSFRKGRLYNPFDFDALIPELLEWREDELTRFLIDKNLYCDGLNALNDAARTVSWVGAPKGWLAPGYPILTVTGPSAVVSWLEARLIALWYPMSLASDALSGVDTQVTTCSSEERIVRSVYESVDRGAVLVRRFEPQVGARIAQLKAAVSLDRVFEVGLRAATCYEAHSKVLECLSAAGISRTSSLAGVYSGMQPVGTVGHEHQQRWGSDKAAFRALRDIRDDVPSYLFDTYSSQSGLLAIAAVAQDTQEPFDVRFDSGDHEEQLEQLLKLTRVGRLDLRRVVFEDGYTPRKIMKMEAVCKKFCFPLERVFYGLGEFFVREEVMPSRSDYGMVYKLSKSGESSACKLTRGKESWPGVPVTIVQSGLPLVVQKGERLPADVDTLNGVRVSVKTRSLVGLVRHRAGG